MRRTPRIILPAAAAFLLLTSAASGYYHYIHFASRSAPFVPVPEKYDLSALRNKTLYYSVTDQVPTALAAGDSVLGLLSQIRLAAKTWNDVGTSDLRLAFGGITPAGTPQNAPGIDIVFDDDVPPGLNALGGVESVSSMVQPAGGNAFVPITRGLVKIRHDIHDTPSYGEALFLTLVHEIGHSLGLQHTLTSAVMSTQITRATTRSKPLADDDIAAISILYPAGLFLSKTATLTGHVNMGGAGVNLASVVAISANNSAISTLTNPDGSYTLQGIPPGNYYVYVHPLPPAYSGETTPGNIRPPQDPSGTVLPATGYFTTQFYPGTRDPNAATTMFLNAGDNKGPIDFNVQRRTTPALSSVSLYGYYGQSALIPAPLLGTGAGAALVATGTGVMPSANVLTPGLKVDVLAQSGAIVASDSVKPWSFPYITFNVYPAFAWSPGPRHLLFSTQDDLYVLPAGLLMVANQGPQISSVKAATDDKGGRAALVAGSNFDTTTRILFDGAPAAILRQNADGTLLVTPPPASPAYRANVVALNGDGQSSLFTQPGGGPAYSYDPADPVPGLSFIYPAALAAGSEAMVEIDGANTGFIDGQTVVGFGSSDIAVRQVWVVSPNKLLANVSVSAGAAVTQTTVTVATGLQLLTAPAGFQITPAPPRMLSVVPPILNNVTGLPGAPAGGTAVLTVPNLTAPVATLAVTVADQRATIISAVNGQVTFQVPAGLPLGAAVVRLQTQTGDTIAPIVMNISPQPPAIAAFLSGNAAVDANHPAHPGTILGVIVAGLPDSVLTGDPSTVKINVGGLDHAAFSVASQPGGTLLQVILSSSETTGAQVPVTVTYAGVTSPPAPIPIQ